MILRRKPDPRTPLGYVLWRARRQIQAPAPTANPSPPTAKPTSQ
jgi:hypothetical protein